MGSPGVVFSHGPPSQKAHAGYMMSASPAPRHLWGISFENEKTGEPAMRLLDCAHPPCQTASASALPELQGQGLRAPSAGQYHKGGGVGQGIPAASPAC